MKYYVCKDKHVCKIIENPTGITFTSRHIFNENSIIAISPDYDIIKKPEILIPKNMLREARAVITHENIRHAFYLQDTKLALLIANNYVKEYE